MFRLDRTVFKKQSLEEASNNVEYWLSKTDEEKLAAANYLNSVAWNYPVDNPPRLDRTHFRMRKRN